MCGRASAWVQFSQYLNLQASSILPNLVSLIAFDKCKHLHIIKNTKITVKYQSVHDMGDNILGNVNKDTASEVMDGDAVIVERAVAGYGQKKILNGLSMRVRRGTIYALLGPSGCGKTTLLSCILGRKSLKSGEITVFNGCPGDRSIGLPGGLVGYMPQEICLYMEFTIQETFQYFGRLQRLSKDLLEKKQIALLDLLDLPEASRRVAALSGGQKRRLSFAVALLHNPKLLILDEPTVGVDPVVRARIWSHLQSLTTSGKLTSIQLNYL